MHKINFNINSLLAIIIRTEADIFSSYANRTGT